MVELSVVMGIIALLFTIGAGAIVQLRNIAQVDAVAEELVNNIRMAQNNSVTIKNGCGGSNFSKLWGVEINSSGTDFSVVTYCGSTITTPFSPPNYTNLSPYKNITILSTGGSGGGGVYFTAPLGKGYSFSGPVSSWSLSGNPQQDYIPSAATASQTLELRYGLTGTVIRTIQIEAGGAIHVL